MRFQASPEGFSFLYCIPRKEKVWSCNGWMTLNQIKWYIWSGIQIGLRVRAVYIEMRTSAPPISCVRIAPYRVAYALPVAYTKKREAFT